MENFQETQVDSRDEAPERVETREWETSEWFARWLELIQGGKPQGSPW